jgi:hypothetical protein
MGNRGSRVDTHEYICDICGKPGLSNGRTAKRHKECVNEYRRRYYNAAYYRKRTIRRAAKGTEVMSDDEIRSAQAVKAEKILHELGLNPAVVKSHCRDIRIALGQNNTTPKIYVKC